MTTKRKKPVQALARRPAKRSLEIIERAAKAAERFSMIVRDPNKLLPVPAPVIDVPAVGTLGEDATVGALGLAEVKLTALEEKVLSEPVLESEVLIKPTGQAYLSHPSYTRWFNRAFGRLGWAIVAKSKPIRQGNSVVCPYVLYIHGQPVAFAYGEQEYFEGNREQTYGDALEATVASALRRCAKRLGVGLELWDKRWLEAFMEHEAVRVKVTEKGAVKWRWRRRSDRPFYNELRGKAAAEVPDEQVEEAQYRQHPERREAPAGYDGGEGIISDKQRKRLWVIIKNAGREQLDVRAWLKDRYGLDSTKKIQRRDYEAICNAVEAKGKLAMPAPREVGEEG